MSARTLQPPQAALLELMRQFERAIRANDYKALAREKQQELRLGLEVYQAVCSVLPRGDKLPQLVELATTQAGHTLTQSNARLLASSLDALLVSLQ